VKYSTIAPAAFATDDNFTLSPMIDQVGGDVRNNSSGSIGDPAGSGGILTPRRAAGRCK
jgi:hypothetical protein